MAMGKKMVFPQNEEADLYFSQMKKLWG